MYTLTGKLTTLVGKRDVFEKTNTGLIKNNLNR